MCKENSNPKKMKKEVAQLQRHLLLIERKKFIDPLIAHAFYREWFFHLN